MRAWVQILGLASMLILGIFLGIDSAEKNMQKMQGIEGDSRAIQITPTTNGKIEISVLGEQVKTKDPLPDTAKEQVKEQVKEVKETVQQSSNHLAAFNNDVGNQFRDTTRKVVELLFGWAK